MEQAFTPHVVELVTETTAALAPLAGLPMYEELKALTEEIFPAQQM